MRNTIPPLFPSLRRLGVAVVLSLTSALVATRASAQEAGIAIGSKAPAAAVESLTGKPMDLASFVGKKPVVMEFWATWCPLCKKLEPAMAAAKLKYGAGVTFVHVGVPQNQSPEKQQAYVTQQQMTGEFVFDRDGSAYKAYKATHTSYVVVVDASGTVVYTGVGPEQDIDAAVQKAMGTGKRGTN
jgi:thiol-disulfide isomerase/thioredoxin